MKKIESDFQNNIKKLFPKTLPKKIAVAVSGGVDSMALLVLFKNIFGKETKIFCIHVDHKTRKTSKDDAKFVNKFCRKNDIPCSVLESYLSSVPDVDVENSLREVRYNLFEEFCTKNKIQYLFLAHHKNDLAENFLIRLFRGSGIDGLAAMNLVRDFSSNNKKIKVIRPLLDCSKDDLKQYLNSAKIEWREDESNIDEKFLRNKIRKFLKTLPESDAIQSRIALASNTILEAKNIIDLKTKKEFPKIFQKQTSGSFLLNLDKFEKLEESIATRYLALCLMKTSGKPYKPRLKKLLRIYDLLKDDKLKAEEFYGCSLKREKAGVVITKLFLKIRDGK